VKNNTNEKYKGLTSITPNTINIFLLQLYIMSTENSCCERLISKAIDATTRAKRFLSSLPGGLSSLPPHGLTDDDRDFLYELKSELEYNFEFVSDIIDDEYDNGRNRFTKAGVIVDLKDNLDKIYGILNIVHTRNGGTRKNKKYVVTKRYKKHIVSKKYKKHVKTKKR
jgi:hypothetical protein